LKVIHFNKPYALTNSTYWTVDLLASLGKGWEPSEFCTPTYALLGTIKF